MLKIAASPTFKAKVQIRAPGGELLAATFEFKHKTQDQLDAYLASDEWRDKPDHQIILGLVVGWDGVDAEFCEESVKTLCQSYKNAGYAITRAYVAELKDAREGN